jgi:hypothetical protein
VPPPPPRRRTPTALLEILGYAGAAAALSATGIAFDMTGPVAQVVIGLVVTVVLVVVGGLVAASDEGLHRMRSVFWFVAVLSWVSVVSVLVGPDGMDLQDKWIVVVAAALTALVAIPLWVRERRSLQLIAAYVSSVLALAALAFTMDTASFFGFEQEIPNIRWSALVLVVVGAAGLAVGLRAAVVPRRTGMVLGALAFLIGAPLVFTDVADQVASAALGNSSSDNLPIVVTILAAAIVLLVGHRAELVAVIGIGIVALGGGVIQLVGTNVEDTGPAVGVLIAGIVLLGAVVVLSRMGGSPPAEAPPPTPPIDAA